MVPFADRRLTSRGALRGALRWALQRAQRLGASAVVAVGLVGAGCESAKRPVRPDVDLHHPSASRRLEAVGAVARSRDVTQVPALFDRLLDDDEAVRLATAAALRDLVGRDPGYRAYDAEAERAAKAAAWRAAWKGAGSPVPSSSGPGGAGYTGRAGP